MQRVSSVALVLLSLAVFGTAGYVVVHNDPVPDAGREVAAPAALIPSSPASASNVASRTPLIAFIGDDWTAGTQASAASKSFPALLARSLGVRELDAGTPGSGYAASGSAGDYLSQVARVVTADPQVVVVSGGRNDVLGQAVSAAGDNAGTLFDRLHARLPNASLVAVAPMWGDSDPPAQLATLAAAVKSAVTAVGGRYLNVADPIHGHSSDMADDADPNDAGYAAIAHVLEPKLRSVLQAVSATTPGFASTDHAADSTAPTG